VESEDILPARYNDYLYCILFIFNFTSPDVFHNYHKIYTFVQHIYNLLQSIHRLHVSALLGHHQALQMNSLGSQNALKSKEPVHL